MGKKVVMITEFVSSSGIDYLREKGYEVIQGPGIDKAAMVREIAPCHGALCRIASFDRDVLDAAPNLRVIAKHGTGVDNVDVEYCTQKKIQVVITPLANAQTTAEHALYLMFALAKNSVPIFNRFRLKGDFSTRNLVGVQLMGKTVGILGLGRVGRALAEKCLGIGMKVIGYDPWVDAGQLDQRITILENRGEVFVQADFVSLHMPFEKNTRHSIGAGDFNLMKETAFFINIARGGIVREDELIEALRKGRIAGAGIDVFEKEPPSVENPLFSMENVIVTPHMGGATRDAMDLMSLHAAIGIDEVLTGRPASWPFNTL